MRQCWFGITQEAVWKKGGEWKLIIPGGQIADQGKVLDIVKGKKIVLTWRHLFTPAFKNEGTTRMTITFKQKGSCTDLTVVHESPKLNSKFIAKVAQGWPMIISGLKSILETGKPIAEFSTW
jgi:uncharacterized protein YndB with AHSA1/START domain